MDWYFVGIDLGLRRDHTAIAVIERAEVQGRFDYGLRAYEKTARLRLRYLERIPLGTPYVDIVRQVAMLTQGPELARRCHLAVDATGVGRPVVEMLRREKPEGIVMPVTITSGQKETTDEGFYRVPKRDLIVGLQMLLQLGELQIAAELPFAAKLVEEMMAMEVRVSAAGNEQYAAWREGTHDDLVFAVALAYWSAQKAYPGKKKEWWTNEYREDADAMFRRWTRLLAAN